jgi:putative membrane protein
MDLNFKTHQKDVGAFKRETEQGTDPEVKAFAAKMLPILSAYLALAKNITGQ